MLVVGRIGKPHGIRGEVTVEVRTDEPGANVPASPGAYRVPSELTVETARWHQGRLLLVAFEGVLDRNVAEALRGTFVGVDRADVTAPTDPEEFHDHQLVGLAVVTSAGERLGEIVRIDHAPAADLLVLRRPGDRDVLIPFVRAIVPEVDLAGGRVVVDPPGGLLDL